uniref:uncharacterized protein n=1 Tax=Myxine glutinosa TaxID=7769 RepID=UPI00358E9958
MSPHVDPSFVREKDEVWTCLWRAPFPRRYYPGLPHLSPSLRVERGSREIFHESRQKMRKPVPPTSQGVFHSLWIKIAKCFPTFLKKPVPPTSQGVFHSLWIKIAKCFPTFLKKPVPPTSQGVFHSLWIKIAKCFPTFLKKPVPPTSQGVFHSLWIKIAKCFPTFLKKPVPPTSQGVFHSLWIKIAKCFPTFLKSLKGVTSKSKQQRTSLFQILGIYSKNNDVNILLVSCITSAVLIWILRILLETLLAFMEVRYTPSLGQFHLQHPPPCKIKSCENILNKGCCHQYDKSLNQRISLISPYKSAKHFQQGNARAMATKGKENENIQSQVKELLKNPHLEFNRPELQKQRQSVQIKRNEENTFQYEASAGSTWWLSSCGPVHSNCLHFHDYESKGDGGEGYAKLAASNGGQTLLGVNAGFPVFPFKHHHSARVIQANYHDYNIRKNLKETKSGNETLITRYIDGDFYSEVVMQVFHLQEESRYASKCKGDFDSIRASYQGLQVESPGMMLESTHGTCSRHNDVIFCAALQRSGMKSPFLVDLAMEEAVITIQAGYTEHLAWSILKKKRHRRTTIQANYRDYNIRKNLKETKSGNETLITWYIDGDFYSEVIMQVFHLQEESRYASKCKGDFDSIRASYQGLQVESPGMMLKSTHGTSSCHNVVVFCSALQRSGMKSPFLVDLAMEEAVITIQAGCTEHLARNILKKMRQSLTTIQANYRDYNIRKNLKETKSGNETLITWYIDGDFYSEVIMQVFHLQEESRYASKCKGDFDSIRASYQGLQVESPGMMLKSTHGTSSCHNAVVFCSALQRSGMKSPFLVDLAMEEAVITIQAGCTEHLARNILKKMRQSLTTIQTFPHSHTCSYKSESTTPAPLGTQSCIVPLEEPPKFEKWTCFEDLYSILPFEEEVSNVEELDCDDVIGWKLPFEEPPKFDEWDYSYGPGWKLPLEESPNFVERDCDDVIGWKLPLEEPPNFEKWTYFEDLYSILPFEEEVSNVEELDCDDVPGSILPFE